MTLILAAFRCPGPDPIGGPPETGGGGLGGLGGGGGDPACNGRPDTDNDGDTFTEEDGDCNDCDPDVHPLAAELATTPGEEPIDDDCDGEVDELPSCEPDSNGAANVSPEAAARAIELCVDADENGSWGLLQTRFLRGNGGELAMDNLHQIRIAKQFGAVLGPQVGEKMLVLSTGVALDATQPGACQNDSCGNGDAPGQAPTGFPMGIPGCVPSNGVFDDVSLEVRLRPPPNAGGFVFYTTFLTHEYPEAVCTPFRDQFLALLAPKPAAWPTPNMIFDSQGIPPSVSFTPFPHCNPESLDAWAEICLNTGCPETPDPYCPEGQELLLDTGFEGGNPNEPSLGGGATGWLETKVPLDGDEPFEIRFLIFDTEDHLRDSTVLIDGFTWMGDVGVGELPATFTQ